MKEIKERLKEWARTERIKIAGIKGTRAKTGYIWDYYKLWIIGIVCLIWFTSFATHAYLTNRHDYDCYMMFCNTNADIGDGSELWHDYISYADLEFDEKIVAFNARSYFDYLKGVTGNTYFETFVTYADGGILDGIVMNSESLVALGETGRLLDLNREECSSIKEKYGDRFLYAVPANEEDGSGEIPVCIDISDSRLVTEYKAYLGTISLGIGANSGNIESVEKFLDFIFEKGE